MTKIYRYEYASLSITLLIVYSHMGNWGLIPILYLIPDITALGFFISTKTGEKAYNLSHTLLLPLILLSINLITKSNNLFTSSMIIWLLHISIDRTLGWNLFPRKTM
ncbi:hypothetical protein CPR19092_LGOLGGFK_01236 [Companilactobacillus paralimentarius]|jgi:hypothetical protein